MKWSTSRKKIFFVDSKEDCRCPCCGSGLKYRDQRLRVHKVAGGKKEWYLVRRLKCTNDKCRKLHNELPDCICPYKHYDAGLIECHSSNYLEPFSSVYLDVLSGSDSVLVRLNGGYSA